MFLGQDAHENRLEHYLVEYNLTVAYYDQHPCKPMHYKVYQQTLLANFVSAKAGLTC
jgi:hypothetical protein